MSQGNAEQRTAEQRILDGSVWNDFCDKLKEMGQLVCRSESPDDVLNRALGYRERHPRRTRPSRRTPSVISAGVRSPMLKTSPSRSGGCR